MRQLLELYKEWIGYEPVSIEHLAGAGSNRAYCRLTDYQGHSVIGCIGTSRDENHAFVYLARHFKMRQLAVPEVLAVSSDEMRYLQEDLGTTSLFDAIRGGREAGGRYTLKEQELLRQTIRELPNVQFRGARGLDFTQCYPQALFDEEGVQFDLNYFKYCFLKPSGLDFHELKLEADFRLMTKDLTAEKSDSFMYRDFQARNVMLASPNPSEGGEQESSLSGRSGETPFFIDFQGGRRGPFYYDLASFLWQASARYPDKLRRELLDEYYTASQQYVEMPKREVFDRRLRLFVFFRTLQVLGAYGFRGYFERKPHFIDSIPAAIQNLRNSLTPNPSTNGEGGQSFPYPYLVSVLQRLVELPQYQPKAEKSIERADGYKTTDQNPYRAHPSDGPATFSKYDGKGPLVVKVYSFSYRKGIPDDESGNGGGYVFDCRSTHNPGRYEPYKQLTGLDEPVIRFLEDDGEILTFLDSVYRLADAHVERYLQRGFTSLMFSFGCTGGQHRSVYSAQHLAEHIHQKYGIEVHICHREQHLSQVLPPLTSYLSPLTSHNLCARQ